MVSRLQSYDQSRFWKRLYTLGCDPAFPGDRTALATLQANVRQVADHSEYILRQIVRYLPQYTLHDRDHILNVLSLMDALTPDDVMNRLGPLECALCVIAAYTHDLGMALRDDEYRAITDPVSQSPLRHHYLRFRDGFGEEVRQLERLKKLERSGDSDRVRELEGHILSEYIRTTHTNINITTGRIRGWLEAMKAPDVANNESLFKYADIDYQEWLILIAASHGHGVGWLRDQLSAHPPTRQDGFSMLVSRGERVNCAFPGLLLRLADIMDFDPSRTPRILFNHIGIDNAVSLKEWNKHLAITGWDLDTRHPNEPRLTYSAIQCPHPVYEKSIRDFASWIDAEIRSLREELHWHRRLLDDGDERYKIHLPREVTLDIRPRRENQKPTYLYRDLLFRLDQAEVQQLLMGESLYGDPSLCIRELLQNALDALELRDLRLQMVAKGEQPHEPVDSLLVISGRHEELRVILTWGHDTESGQDYLCVEDNGVGMTEDVITRYFTQIGKSFYHSSTYLQELGTLRANGLIASPISIFGIGILSCFMIADRLEVRTRPCGADNVGRAPHDITISGPGSLFWLRSGTRDRAGTEIKLFLKSRFRIEHDAQAFLPGLRRHFGYSLDKYYSPDDRIIDPPFSAAAHVVWPRYPIEVAVPQGQTIRIDGRFHLDILAPINRKAVLAEAVEWKCPPEFIGPLEWGVWDWEDAEGPEASGSRIRLWFPSNHTAQFGPDLPIDPPEGKNLCRQHELATFVEPQLEGHMRSRVLVRGMQIESALGVRDYLEITPTLGTRAWIDLQGSAAPGLTADRRRTIIPQDRESWEQAVSAVFKRAATFLVREGKDWTQSLRKNFFLEFRWRGGFTLPKPIRDNCREFALEQACTTLWNTNFNDITTWKYLTLISSLERGLPFDRARERARESVISPNYTIIRTLEKSYALSSDLAKDVILKHDFALNRAHSIRIYMLLRYGLDIFRITSIQEEFFPTLSSNWLPFESNSLSGRIGEAALKGPGLVIFDLEQDGRTVHFTDPGGSRPEVLVQRGYDLSFPMTAIPLGALRRLCPAWRTDSRYFSLGLTPFLFPDLDEIWSKHAEFLKKTFGVPRIFALLPRLELWSKPFTAWEDDWHTCGLSALWQLDTGRVLWANGAHDVDAMLDLGRTAKDFFGDTLKPE